MIKYRKSFIVGLKGIFLAKKEIFFLKKYKPWGVILFSRNIKSIEQVQKLIFKIKSIFNDKNYPILIDQEGGRVSRVEKIIITTPFSGEYFGFVYKEKKKNISQHINIYINQISYLLREIGVNINTLPVLDIRRKNANLIIGDRSFSNNPKIVKKIGSLFIEKLHKNKIATVIKHIPGHGLAKSDSHISTPKVKNNLKYLIKNDFFPFKNQKSLFAMTAHIIYESIDPILTATHSKKMINIIRNKYLGEWASQKLNKNNKDQELYIQEVIKSDFSEPGDEDVFRKIKDDLAKAGFNNIDDEIRNKMNELMDRAKKDFS